MNLLTWIESLVLGAVQGLTEFLPVSSDGHLIVTANVFSVFTGVSRSEKENIFFFVMLHLGTLVAILAHYRKEILAGIKGLFGSTRVPEMYQRNVVIRVGILVALSTSVLIPDKLFFLKYMEQAFDSPLAIGVGFWVTAAALLVTMSKLAGGDKGPAETTILDALLIGLAQAFAPLPGVSRSGLTVATALALGFRRNWAVQYSLMLAVPAIMGAAVFEIKDIDRSTMTTDRILQTVAASVVAGLVGYAAIVWLVRVVRAGRLWYFSVYLVVLGLATIVGFALLGKRNAAAPPTTGRAAWTYPARVHDRRVSMLQKRAVARPVVAGEEASRA